MQTRDEVEGLHNRREFSQRLECLYQAMQTQEKVFYCYYKITFMRKNAKLYVWHWLKEKFLPVAKSCPRSLACVIISCFAKRLQNTDFSSSKCQLKRRKIDSPSLWRFSMFQPTKEWVNKVNLSSFELETFSKFVLAWLAFEKPNNLTPQPCLHTLMQTLLLLANQSARTILVIL